MLGKKQSKRKRLNAKTQPVLHHPSDAVVPDGTNSFETVNAHNQPPLPSVILHGNSNNQFDFNIFPTPYQMPQDCVFQQQIGQSPTNRCSSQNAIVTDFMQAPPGTIGSAFVLKWLVGGGGIQNPPFKLS